MAQVIEAVAFGHGGFERRVAIKRLLPQHARDGERRRMFFEEARIGSRMHHGGIVPIFDYGLIDGSEFMAMEYVEGLDALRAVSGSTPDIVPMPEGIALHITAEIAHALAYIHDLRDEDNRALAIVHRDVSPPNILLSWNGDVKLSDFGIALSRAPSDDGAERRIAASGGVQGKLHYMAPEQARGEPVGAAADVYALGATLDALLGGGAHGPVTSEESGNAREAAALRARALAARVRPHPIVPRARCRGSGRAPPTSRRAPACSRRRCWEPTAAARCARGWSRSARAWASIDALDDLMGLCLVPVAGEGARTFTFSRVWETPSSPPAARRPAADALAQTAVRGGGDDDRVRRDGVRLAHRPPQQGADARVEPARATAPARQRRRAGRACAPAASIAAAGAPAPAASRGAAATSRSAAGCASAARRWWARACDADGAFVGFAPARAVITRRIARDPGHVRIGPRAGSQALPAG